MYPLEELSRLDQFMDGFEDTIQAYYDLLTATSGGQAEAAKAPLGKCLDQLEAFFADDDSAGPFVLGNTFSVAECFAAPWVHRFDIVLPHFRSLRVRDLVSSTRVQTWLDAVLERPSVQSTNGPTDYVLSSTQGYFVNYITPGSPAETGVGASY